MLERKEMIASGRRHPTDCKIGLTNVIEAGGFALNEKKAVEVSGVVVAFSSWLEMKASGLGTNLVN